VSSVSCQLGLASKSSRWCVAILFVLVSLSRSAVAASRGTNVPGAPIASLGPGSSTAIADFDGDQRLDCVSVVGGQIGSASTNYLIQFELTASGRQVIQVTGPSGGLAIEARDVNGDHAIDLVITTAWLRQPVAILLNDGHGRFSRAEPNEFPGAFGSSNRKWVPSSNQASETVAIPPQTRSGLCSEAMNLPDVRGSNGPIRTANSGFLRYSFLIATAGRAPPCKIS
jgi:hypothetical protein